MAQAAMASRDTSASDLCKELGVKTVTHSTGMSTRTAKGEARSPLDRELDRISRTRGSGWCCRVLASCRPFERVGHDRDAAVVHRGDRPDLISLPVPIAVAGFPLQLGWHRRRSKDTGLRRIC